MKNKLHAFLFLLTSITGFSQTLDPTFGTNGKVITHISDDQDAITSIALQPDGKIVASGMSRELGEFRTLVCRYNADGSLDTSFGTNGKVVFNELFHESINCKLKLQSDGKIVIATNKGDFEFNYNFMLVRLNNDGSYDSGFGNNGVVITDFETGTASNIVRSIELQPDGKIILGGECSGNDGTGSQYENFAIARYNTDGSLDSGFGTNGKVSINIGSNSISSYSIDGIYSVKLQSSGKIILAGYTDAQNSIEVYNAALVRLNTDGTIDTAFGTNGKTITSFPVASAGIGSIVINSDDSIVAGEIVGFGSNDNTKIDILKYDANGNLDTSFGTNGRTITQVNATAMRDTIWEMALQPDGKILATGYSVNATIDMVLLRYTASGILDTTFDGDGILLTDFNNTADGSYALLVQPDGKIVVGGLSGLNPNYEFALARYTFENLNISNPESKGLKIYPNPVKSILNIQNAGNAVIKKTTVTDVTGKKIIEQEAVSQLNVESLTPGIYFLELDYEGGKQTEKFIKQ
ncbi:T9SS type A sorting domain-containing protein [Flavobacterium wongokense]|uniref:T9SS type A sorting domain-containing protein n=1 Tax=Flavobacterium wongokense TaxID=2910674 RepID=UPI001F38FBEE|nr:T9SS type A sorting domain-containing protein [Flavobacterium sp. WG47]MCF6132453.1 T9SS type A sorting domain-containing protein [Flavobacterium sp. WG47]